MKDITKKEYFAGLAMQAMISSPGYVNFAEGQPNTEYGEQAIAVKAVSQAEELPRWHRRGHLLPQARLRVGSLSVAWFSIVRSLRARLRGGLQSARDSPPRAREAQDGLKNCHGKVLPAPRPAAPRTAASGTPRPAARFRSAYPNSVKLGSACRLRLQPHRQRPSTCASRRCTIHKTSRFAPGTS